MRKPWSACRARSPASPPLRRAQPSNSLASNSLRRLGRAVPGAMDPRSTLLPGAVRPIVIRRQERLNSSVRVGLGASLHAAARIPISTPSSIRAARFGLAPHRESSLLAVPEILGVKTNCSRSAQTCSAGWACTCDTTSAALRLSVVI